MEHIPTILPHIISTQASEVLVVVHPTHLISPEAVRFKFAQAQLVMEHMFGWDNRLQSVALIAVHHVHSMHAHCALETRGSVMDIVPSHNRSAAA
jgi:hypothetical protein